MTEKNKRILFLVIAIAALGLFTACNNKAADATEAQPVVVEADIAPVPPAETPIESDNAERNENREKDIEILEKQLNAYIKLFYDIENSDKDKALNEQFQGELKKLFDDIDNLDGFDMAFRIQMITALFHDGHMLTDFMFSDYYENSYPIYFNTFADGIYCISVYDAAYSNALNAKIEAINGIAIDEVFEKFQLLFTGDNIYDSKQCFGRRLHCPHILKALDIVDNIDDPVIFTLTDLEGYSFDMQIEQMPRENQTDEITNRVEGDEAYYKSKNDPVWMDYLEDDKIMYIRMYYIPQSNELDGMNDDLINILENNDVDKVVLDFRINEGGMLNSIRSKLFDSLIAFGTEGGNLYVITDHDTFSMAAIITMHLKEEGNAIIVGLVPGGGNPYIGNVRKMTLNNIALTVGIPTNNAYKNGMLDFGPDIKNNIIPPDIEIGINITDYINKTDSVFELIKSME